MDAAAVLQALVSGELAPLASALAMSGKESLCPAPGIFFVRGVPAAGREQPGRLILSVGVHGDETAPIEMLARLLAELLNNPAALALDLMVAVGNLDAIGAGKRFIDADLNRLFTRQRGDLAEVREARRADSLMEACEVFLDGTEGLSWHLDLHTAIRPSKFPAFAIVPDLMPAETRERFIGWLGQAGIDAAILNRQLAPTFSAYTAQQFGAVACTLELGQVSQLGSNDPAAFAATEHALRQLLRADPVAATPVRPKVFRVAQELRKLTPAFALTIGREAPNFTAFEPGSTIASDGEHRYVAGEKIEYVVFPNPDVRVGLRAGLLVVESDS